MPSYTHLLSVGGVNHIKFGHYHTFFGSDSAFLATLGRAPDLMS